MNISVYVYKGVHEYNCVCDARRFTSQFAAAESF